ncbi:MAG: UDP-N-acetylmuramoyl-L-alanyl-D-glutamate--2,6-diaminopimelate ligase [Phycisphaeraceae bacterium]|nr:UDP-N-acetylmuramoyl-L-alanyl-D-glutamate--2,6-diaminopimelate ligase [Phycisphaeraceae bacterium]
MDFETLKEKVYEGQMGMCTDSRQVQPGDVFVAINGPTANGHEYTSQAIERGASAVVCETPITVSVPAIRVPNSALAAAKLTQALHQYPAQHLTNLAVTGTNGKTTVTYMVQACFKAANLECGLIGTIEYDCGAGKIPAPLTTPDCCTLASQQAAMVQAGLKAMVIETSSHALTQGRVADIDFQAAAFTNLTGDHLDYHLTEENYLNAKASLFEGLSETATAVLNADVPQGHMLAARTRARTLMYSVYETDELCARIQQTDMSGTYYTLHYQDQAQAIHCALPGQHNVSNQLAAAGLCLAAGLDLETIAQGLNQLMHVTGRLERVPFEGEFTVLIDYAHTDDALKNVLSTLRPLCEGRLILVFGCGGARDKTKRPRMARVADQLADLIVVTSDNPRTESPEAIIRDILRGFSGPVDNKVLVEPDRRSAIEKALAEARHGDTVLIAGKGHETYQILGTHTIHFNDSEVALATLNNPEQP